jgi:glucose/arabinose dehydrogenase
MRPFVQTLTASAVLLLAACATPSSEAETRDNPPPAAAGEPAAARPPAKPPYPETPAAETPAMTCDAAKVQWTVGQLADETLVAKAKTESGSERLRVIKPGMAVTMDYREDRLNLDVDADNKVTRAYCG